MRVEDIQLRHLRSTYTMHEFVFMRSDVPEESLNIGRVFATGQCYQKRVRVCL